MRLASLLARQAREVPLVCHSQGDEIRMINAKLVRNAVHFAFFGRRDCLVCSRQCEQTLHQRKLLVIGRELRELPRDQKIGRSSKEEIARLGQLHDDHRLILRQLPVSSHERFHGRGFFRRHVLVGMSDAPEQVREGGEVSCTFRREVIQCLERVAKRRELLFLRSINAQPGANRLQGYIH
jgi:hypothetical protein